MEFSPQYMRLGMAEPTPHIHVGFRKNKAAEGSIFGKTSLWAFVLITQLGKMFDAP
jgi:hypothetical protein